MMTRLLVVLGAGLALAGPLAGQSAQEKAEQDLLLAKTELQKLQVGILDEETELIGSVDKLDNQVLELTRTLSKLLAEEESLAGRQKKLDDEIAGRKGEFEFTLSSLRSYSRGLVNRLHGAEIQRLREDVDTSERWAQRAGDDLPEEIRARIGTITLGAKRLQSVAGGARFEGKAVGPGNVLKDGTFVVAGPLGYFAAADGTLAGFTSFSAAGVDFPSVAPLKAEEGGTAVAQLVKTGSAEAPVDATMGRALQVARTKKSLGDYLKGGGVVGYGILGLGAAALLIALFKFVEINTFPVPGRKTINDLLDDLLDGRAEEAGERAAAVKGMCGDLVRAGVKYFFAKRRIMEDALMETLSIIQPRLDRYLPFLALAAAAAPMMGLLGTVLGIMKTFAVMSAVGTGDSSAFSAGISEALITTAMGLIVAIPVIIIHGTLKSLAKAKFGQVEGVALSLLNGTTEIVVGPAPADDHEAGDHEDEDLDERELAPA